VGLIAGTTSTLLALAFGALFVALSTGAATGTSGDRTMIGVLTAIFLVAGVLLIVREIRNHRGLRPTGWAIVASTVVGTAGVLGGAVLVASFEVDLNGNGGKLAALVAMACGLGPGIGLYHLLTRGKG
jgi:hypothetical protein